MGRILPAVLADELDEPAPAEVCLVDAALIPVELDQVLGLTVSHRDHHPAPFRELLHEQWGVVDVDDCAAAATWLAEQGLADPRQLAIRGGSAGGYTTLAALCFKDVCGAGTSFFGLGDLEAFTDITHKFESRYMDYLIGPYPEMAERYRERSPDNHSHRISCPVLVMQGADDKVVPPSQAEGIVRALQQNGLPHAYILFEGEGHGFRIAANQQRALEAVTDLIQERFGEDE